MTPSRTTIGSKRGGKRAGAGRPPLITYSERLKIGARCERLWREVGQAKEKAAVDAAIPTALRYLERAKGIPIGKRKKWLKSQDGRDYLGDVDSALVEDQYGEGAKRKKPSHRLVIGYRRPKGVRKQIMDQVAAQFGITPRMVESCWKEFRASAKSED
jgi:hypothetical protein